MTNTFHLTEDRGCIKTGCNVYLAETRQFAHGDAFQVGDTLLMLRLVTQSITRDQPFSHLHFTVNAYGIWLDQSLAVRTSTMLAHNWINHGYNGVPLVTEIGAAI